jgi:hypothetical protein
MKHCAYGHSVATLLNPCGVATVYNKYSCKPWNYGNVCLRSEDVFVIACVANLMEVKVLYIQQDLRYEISSYWRFNV